MVCASINVKNNDTKKIEGSANGAKKNNKNYKGTKTRTRIVIRGYNQRIPPEDSRKGCDKKISPEAKTKLELEDTTRGRTITRGYDQRQKHNQRQERRQNQNQRQKWRHNKNQNQRQNQRISPEAKTEPKSKIGTKADSKLQAETEA